MSVETSPDEISAWMRYRISRAADANSRILNLKFGQHRF
jgi:hypothetical protein